MAQHFEPVIPPPPGITSNFEHPRDALHTVNKVTQILCLVVTTVVVIIRALVRIHLHRSVTLEDCKSHGIVLSERSPTILTAMCSQMQPLLDGYATRND